MAYTAGFSVNVGDPTKASDVTTLAANDDFLKAAVDAIMADSATPSSTLKAAVVLADGVTATTQSAGNNTTRVATTAFVKTAVDASSTDPAGSNTQIQYNNSGAFGASADLTFTSGLLVNAGQGIGVGETPSTWASGFDFVQIGGTLALASQPGVQASQAAYIVQNAHYDSDGSWEYQATDEAHRIGMSSGNITFDNAASGTAGNDITWSERMRILPSGGITFNGDTSAANALDDYETGSFTPTLGAHSSDGTHSYTTQVGNYTKVGNMVSVWLKLVINTLNTSGTISGNLEIKGLPFTSANTTGQLYMGTFLPSGLVVSGTGPVTMMGINGTTVSMAEANDNAGYSMFTSSDVASGDSFFIQFNYPV